MQVIDRRFKRTLKVAENPLTQQLLTGVMSVNNNRLPVTLGTFQVGDYGHLIAVPGAPIHDKIVCKPKGSSDQGWCED